MKRLRYLWRVLHYRFRVSRQEIRFLADRLRRGDAAVDVGAHKGAFLYWLRQGVGAHGRVYGFEPQPLLAQYVKEIVRMQGWDNVTVEACALSSASGAQELYVPAPQGQTSPSAALSRPDPRAPHYSVRVAVTTLDEYFRRPAPARIAFIKCDCEGHELEVFKGGQNLLRCDRPALLFECEQRHIPGGSPSTVFDYLKGLGYRGWFFGPDGLVAIEQFRLDLHQPVRPGRFWDAKDYYNSFAFVPG